MPEQKEQTPDLEQDSAKTERKTKFNGYSMKEFDFGKIIISYFPKYDRNLPETGIAVLTYWGKANSDGKGAYEKLIINGEGRVFYAEVGKYDDNGVARAQVLGALPANLNQRKKEVSQLLGSLEAVDSEQSDAMDKYLEQMLKDGTINFKKEAA